MNLLRYAASKFEVPLTHTVYRINSEQTYDLIKISFTDRRLIATYGDEDYDYDFDIVIRGIA